MSQVTFRNTAMKQRWQQVVVVFVVVCSKSWPYIIQITCHKQSLQQQQSESSVRYGLEEEEEEEKQYR